MVKRVENFFLVMFWLCPKFGNDIETLGYCTQLISKFKLEMYHLSFARRRIKKGLESLICNSDRLAKIGTNSRRDHLRGKKARSNVLLQHFKQKIMGLERMHHGMSLSMRC